MQRGQITHYYLAHNLMNLADTQICLEGAVTMLIWIIPSQAVPVSSLYDQI